MMKPHFRRKPLNELKTGDEILITKHQPGIYVVRNILKHGFWNLSLQPVGKRKLIDCGVYPSPGPTVWVRIK